MPDRPGEETDKEPTVPSVGRLGKFSLFDQEVVGSNPTTDKSLHIVPNQTRKSNRRSFEAARVKQEQLF